MPELNIAIIVLTIVFIVFYTLGIIQGIQLSRQRKQLDFSSYAAETLKHHRKSMIAAGITLLLNVLLIEGLLDIDRVLYASKHIQKNNDMMYLHFHYACVAVFLLTYIAIFAHFSGLKKRFHHPWFAYTNAASVVLFLSSGYVAMRPFMD